MTMIPNKMFPVDISDMEKFPPAASAKNESKLCHLRYIYVNINDLKLLGDKGSDSKKIVLLIYVKVAFMGKLGNPFLLGRHGEVINAYN